jgi:sporulation protein YlmC with PRC-barrel domain
MFVRDLAGKDVLTRDSHKIGKVENLLVDMHSGDIDLVVLPHLITKLVRDHAGNISGQITGAAISTLKQFIPGVEIAEMAISQAGGYAGMRASGKVKTLINVIQESYYLVPLQFLEKNEHEQIILGIDRDDCRKWCLNAIPVPEVQVSFYKESHYSGPKRPVPITVFTSSLESLILEDTRKVQAVIKDIAIDDSTNNATGLVVSDSRDGSTRVIKLSHISFHGEKLATSGRLDEYQKL